MLNPFKNTFGNASLQTKLGIFPLVSIGFFFSQSDHRGKEAGKACMNHGDITSLYEQGSRGSLAGRCQWEGEMKMCIRPRGEMEEP